ncbi:unnamed protein product [marine sediment metagenome]|uniref:Uncharacterized protein n=1 Tax=marine sediment metagenome TaxID=412755 RepID=X0SWW4_9ZZZZ
MKKRTGFVSNSSSSSFICEVSGACESGYDAGLSDFEMCECVNGHIFFEKYLLEGLDVQAVKLNLVQQAQKDLDNHDPDKVTPRYEGHTEALKKWFPECKEDYAKATAWLQSYEGDNVNELIDDYAEEFDEDSHVMPAAFCPICSLQHVQDGDLLSYLLAVVGETREGLTAKVQERYSGLDALDAEVVRLNKGTADAKGPVTIGKTNETA